MNERHRGTWHFVTYDDEEAECLIKFCNNTHVRLYAYAKHIHECSKPHWHFIFLFYRPISLYQIAVLSDSAVFDPGVSRGSFNDHLCYLKSKGDVVTNYRHSY